MTPMSFTKLNVPLVKSLGLKLPPLFTKLNVCITIGQKVKHDRFIWPIRNTKSERNTNVTLEQQQKTKSVQDAYSTIGQQEKLKTQITERKNQT